MKRKDVPIHYVHDLLLGCSCPCSHRDTDEHGNEKACPRPASYDAIYIVKPVPDDDLWHTPIGYCETHGGRAQAEHEAIRRSRQLTADAACSRTQHC